MNKILVTLPVIVIIGVIAILALNSNQNSEQCIITIFGNRYDVTSLQTTHSGGNVYECGTDMSQTYRDQHGTDVSRIQPYLIP